MHDLKLEFEPKGEWPRLAWLAEFSDSDPLVRVRHGRAVETDASWFCEAVWDGEFGSGDFDQTDLVYGSGGRIREGRMIFVASGSTVDRLQFLRLQGRFMVSNSLACLLAMSGVRVVSNYDRYPDFFRSIVNGLDAYERVLPTQLGVVELCYFRNLVWDGRDLSEVDKPDIWRDFSSFDRYRAFLRDSLCAIARNMKAAERSHAYEMVSAISSGYDSSAAAVLGREAGMQRAFSFKGARGGDEDHGSGVAAVLGLELALINRTEWRNQALAEVPYFAATGLGPDVIFSGARQLLQSRVVLTGFHGDKVWGKDTEHLGPDIVRGDASGLSFTEHRLELGCIHVPVPFMGVRQIRDIHSLSNSAELAQWEVPGDYSRPVPRRIIEGAGVPRGLFGIRKQAATSLFRQGEALLTDETRRTYHRWLADHAKRGDLVGARSQYMSAGFLAAVRQRFYLLSRVVSGAWNILPAQAATSFARTEARLERWLNRQINVVQHLFPWAIEKMAEKYKPRKESP